MGSSEPTTLGIETTTVLIASFRGRPVYLHLWEIPHELILAAASPNSKDRRNTAAGVVSHSQLDVAFFGAHGCILVLDSRDTTMESAKAVDETRDVIQRMLTGSSRVFSDDTDYLQRMLKLSGAPPTTGLGSSSMVDVPERALRFPLYLLAHKADHPAAAVAASGEFGKDEHSPGIHFADSQFERMHGQSKNGYPPAWYTRHPRHDAAENGMSSFKYALGMTPDEIGNYARLAGFRGWWWTSSLPSLLGADQAGAASKKKVTTASLVNLPKKLKGVPLDTSAIYVRKEGLLQAVTTPSVSESEEKQGRSFFSGLFGFGGSGDNAAVNNSSSSKGAAQGLSTLTQTLPQLLENISASYVASFPTAASDAVTGGDKSDATAPLTSLQVVFASIVDDCLEYYEFLSSEMESSPPQETQSTEGIISF